MLEIKKLGRRGEEIACEYLLKNKYKIIARNYKKGYQEVDIIAQKNKELIFVEVKTRLKNKESLFENPLLVRQVKNLKIAILNYAHDNKIDLEKIHLDLIFILVDKNKKTADLKHYRDIF